MKKETMKDYTRNGEGEQNTRTKRLTISLPQHVYEAAVERQNAFRYTSFSGYIGALIDKDCTELPAEHTRTALPAVPA
jgi:hypothetical protein